ncbi:hypothetical protein L1887_35397 [Cichorium endivia]|nr:hypothetical protein L1887_35397 [Cichorium endivia]
MGSNIWGCSCKWYILCGTMDPRTSSDMPDVIIDDENPTTGAAVSLINKMVDDGIIIKGSELWCFEMTLFEDAMKRELFLSLPNDARSLAWLNYKNNLGN